MSSSPSYEQTSQNQSLRTVRNLLILKPFGMSVGPPESGSIVPIIPGSITLIGDRSSCPAS